MTLLEVLIGAVLLGLVLGVLYQIFYTTSQQGVRIDARYEALRSAHMATEILGRELEKLVTLPVARDPQGKAQPRYGDHYNPALVAQDGRGISFYVPAPDVGTSLDAALALPMSIELVGDKVRGVYKVLRRMTPGDGEEALAAAALAGEELTAGDQDERTFGGVWVKTMKVRVLSPRHPVPALRSPDENHYVEATITGTDRTGQEENTVTKLERLRYPSAHIDSPEKMVLAYAPVEPLATPESDVNPTLEEEEVAKELTTIAYRYRVGELPESQFLDEARTTLEKVEGKTSTGAIDSDDGTIKNIDDDAEVLNPDDDGSVTIGKDGDPSFMIDPSLEDKLINKDAPEDGWDPDEEDEDEEEPEDEEDEDEPEEDEDEEKKTTKKSGKGWVKYWGTGMAWDSNGNTLYQNSFKGGGDIATFGEGQKHWEDFESKAQGIHGDLTNVATANGAKQPPPPLDLGESPFACRDPNDPLTGDPC